MLPLGIFTLDETSELGERSTVIFTCGASPQCWSVRRRVGAAAHLCIALCILEQSQQELAALLRPAPLPSGGPFLLGLRCPAHATAEAMEGDHAPATVGNTRPSQYRDLHAGIRDKGHPETASASSFACAVRSASLQCASRALSCNLLASSIWSLDASNRR